MSSCASTMPFLKRRILTVVRVRCSPGAAGRSLHAAAAPRRSSAEPSTLTRPGNMRRLALVSTGHKGLSALLGLRYSASWTKQGSVCLPASQSQSGRRSRRGMLTASERSQTRSPWRHNRKRSRSKFPIRPSSISANGSGERVSRPGARRALGVWHRSQLSPASRRILAQRL